MHSNGMWNSGQGCADTRPDSMAGVVAPSNPTGIHASVNGAYRRVRELVNIMGAVRIRLVGHSPVPCDPSMASKDPSEPSTLTLHDKLSAALCELEELAQHISGIIG